MRYLKRNIGRPAWTITEVTVVQAKLQQSMYMPWGFQEDKASRFQEHKGSKVVNPTHRPPLRLPD